MIKLDNVTYNYAFCDKPAVKNINLEVKSGEIVLCTGASGCGKSTLIRLINGLCPHYYSGELQGDVFINDKSTSEQEIGDISSTVGTLFQDPERQFFALSVEDELAFALEWKGYSAQEIIDNVHKTASHFKINNILDSSIHKLSEGQKQKVGLASIFTQSPNIIILDEPTANLDPESTVSLAKMLLHLKEAGMAVFVVDHRLYWLNGIADKVIVMADGEIVEQGGFDVLNNDELRNKYCLRSSKVEDNRSKLQDIPADAEKAVCVDNMSFGWTVDNVLFDKATFHLTNGVTALIGDNGTGKTTLARLLTGLTKVSSGNVSIPCINEDSKSLLKETSLVLQNADHQLCMKSVYDELKTNLELCKKFSNEEIPTEIEKLLNMFSLSHLSDRHPQALSGGEKQRLVIACAFSKQPKLLILDEPTSGLDGKNMKRIAEALKILKEANVPILLITHDLELMNSISDYALRLPIK